MMMVKRKTKATKRESDPWKRRRTESPLRLITNRVQQTQHNQRKCASKSSSKVSSQTRKETVLPFGSPEFPTSRPFRQRNHILRTRKNGATKESASASKEEKIRIDEGSDVEMELNSQGSPTNFSLPEKGTNSISKPVINDAECSPKRIPVGIEINSSLTCTETLEETKVFRKCIQKLFASKKQASQKNPIMIDSYSDLGKCRSVCKQWNSVLADRSLKYGKLSEDLDIMMKNENKHYALGMRDYLSVSGSSKEISPAMRGILVDWLVEVAEEFRLDDETLFLCVHYIDRYLSTMATPRISKASLQLLGGSLSIPSLFSRKYEEIHVPTVCDIAYIADNTYTKEEILTMEINLLNALHFDITVCTIKRFVQYFLKTAESGFNKLREQEASVQKARLENLANYISELALVDHHFAIMKPSLVGASAVCLALHVEGLTWTYILESESHYSFDDLNACVSGLWNLFIEAPKSPLQAVHNKFAQSKYDSVSTKTLINYQPFNSNNTTELTSYRSFKNENALLMKKLPNPLVTE